MTITNTNLIAKIAALAAGFGLVALSFASSAPAARAATIEELQAQVAALMAQIAAMNGTSAYATFTTDQTVGSTGVAVTALQNFLISHGYGIPAGATGYFGAQTQAALAAFQAANGIQPAVGYFGTLTRAKVNAMGGASTGGTSGSTGGSAGGSSSSSDKEGYLDHFDQLSSFNHEEVGEGEKDVPVLGVEMDARDADQRIERVSVVIDTPTGNDDLEDLIDSVSVSLDGKKLASMDVKKASYTRSADRYTFRFTNLKGMIDEGDTGELTVNVTGAKNVDSADEGDGWTVSIPADGIRAVSPDGTDDTYSGSSFSTTFTVESFASANDVELKAVEGDDNPDEGIVTIDHEGDDVTLLEFELTAKGSDIDVTELPFDLVSSGADVEDLIDELRLEWSKDDSSENVADNNSTTQTVSFDDLDLTIKKGDTVSFRLIGKSATSTPFGGASLSASLAVNSIEAEDQSGEDIGAADLTGSANGDEQHFFAIAPEVDVVSTSITPINNGNAPAESATAKIKVKLTARGGTIYLNGDDEATAAKEFFLGAPDAGDASTTLSAWTHTVSGNYSIVNAGMDDEYYVVNEDRSITVEFTGVISQLDGTESAVLAGLKSTGIQFGTNPASDTTRSAYLMNWSDLLDQLQTSKVALVNPS